MSLVVAFGDICAKATKDMTLYRLVGLKALAEMFSL